MSHEALAVLEIDGVARATLAQDAALKRAQVEVLGCAPLSPGKMALLLAGPVAIVEESLAAALEIAGSRLISRRNRDRAADRKRAEMKHQAGAPAGADGRRPTVRSRKVRAIRLIAGGFRV